MIAAWAGSRGARKGLRGDSGTRDCYFPVRIPSDRCRLVNLRNALLPALLLALAGCAHQPEVPPAAFGSTQTLSVGQTVRFDDGLSLELERVEDSRCRQGMQCVWAGELAPILQLRGGFVGDKAVKLRLATGSSPAKQQGPYHFTLRQATPEAASITVNRSR